MDKIEFYLHKAIEEAERDLAAQVDEYILSLFGGSLEKFKELAPLYILEEWHTDPEPMDIYNPDQYTLTISKDVRLRPKNYDE